MLNEREKILTIIKIASRFQSILSAAKTHRNRDNGSAFESLVGRIQKLHFSLYVQGTGRFVQHKTNTTPQYSTCQTKQLSLS